MSKLYVLKNCIIKINLRLLTLINSNNYKMKTKFNGFLTLLLALVVQISFAQEKTISGTVSDESGGLPGVSVIIKGTLKGTETDFDGKYSVKVKTGDILVFSYLGYKQIEKVVSASNTINVSMEEDANVLEEIVITGYKGAVNNSKIASAIAVVGSEKLDQVPISSLDQVLQGTAAGVSVNVGSGQPGQSGTILIRGRGSISGDIEPLFIIDGVPVDQDNFRSLNTNDIKSVSVLKDAAATSIYGNRGAGGVILVTTKTGKIGQNLSVSYSSLYGISTKPPTTFSVMNSSQFLNFQRDLVPGNQFGDGLSVVELDAIIKQSNTNWSDVLFSKGKTVSHQLTITNGGENSTSFSSIQYFEQEGITLGSALKRFSFRTNNTGSSKDKKFNYATRITLNYSKNNFIVDNVDGNGGQLDNPFLVPYIGLPYLSPYGPNGQINYIGTRLSGAYNDDGSINEANISGFQNTPFIALNSAKFNTDAENEFRGIIGLNADYRLTDNFTTGVSFGLDYTNEESLRIIAPNSIRGYGTPTLLSEVKGSQLEVYARRAAFITNAFLRYNKDITDKFNLTAAIFGEYNYTNNQFGGFRAYGLNPALPGSGSGFTSGDTSEGPEDELLYNYVPDAFSSETDIALASYFGTLDLDYDGRYGLSAVVRRDITSRFPKNSAGTFWSLGGRWNIDKEEFMSDVNWVNSLKLRASYGIVGNQNVGSRYQGLQTISSNPSYQLAAGYGLPQLVDENIKWETTAKLNIGVGFSLFESRLSGELDFYREVTSDLFSTNPVSAATTGFSSVTTNVGELSNQGVDLQLSYDILRKSSTNPWAISVNAQGNYNKNNVESLSDGTEFIGNTVRTAVGRPLRSWFEPRWAGVNPANGEPLYLDINGDITNVYSAANAVYLDKSADPTYTGGFGTNIEYKGFSLNANFSFAADQWRNNGSLAIIEDVGLAGFANMSTTLLDAWTTPGQVTSIPALSFGGLRGRDGDRYLEDASFLRLRNVTFSYDINSDVLKSTKLFKSARIFIQGTNLITWSKWRGFDPEGIGAGAFFDYPVPKTFTFGLNLTL